MLDKRPIAVITIGYVLGIIMGLYCKISIAFLYLLLYIGLLIVHKRIKMKKKFKLISFRRYLRYVKLIFTKKVILIIMITSIISNSIVIYQNKCYKQIYSNYTEICIVGEVVSNKKEKEYKNIYKIKVKNRYFYLNVDKKEKELRYGDIIKINGEYEEPESARNYGGFNYKEYLKTLRICGTIKAKSIVKLNQKISVFSISNNVFLEIKQIIQANFNPKVADIILGISLGYTEEIDEDIIESFSDNNISHILAISGMHIGFLIKFIKIIAEKTAGKRRNKIITLIFLIIYMFITGFSPSVVRACFMAILAIIASLVHRKNDIWQSMSLCLLIILIYNPYLVKSISVLLTFAGTLGIICKPKGLKGSIAVTVFATLWIMPIVAILFNKIAFFSLIISLIIGFIVSPLICLVFIFIVFFHILELFKVKIILINIIIILTETMLKISNFGSSIPLKNILVVTPNVWQVILYYSLLIICLFLHNIYNKRKISVSEKRVKNLISLAKFRLVQNKKKVISYVLIIAIICCFYLCIPKDLKIYFIDVGQGDSTLIITPNNRSILIDGGGSESR